MPVAVAATPPADWRSQVFAGTLLIVPQVAPLTAFRAYVEQLLDEAFAPSAPPAAQDELAAADFMARIEQLRTWLRGDAHARQLLIPVLAHFGLEPSTTFWDRLNVRVLPAGARPQHEADLALGAHRDTWSSNVYAQVNWWLPLYPVTAERAVAFYPRHWDTPVPNDSGGWDLDQLRRERREGAAPTVPLVPSPTGTVDPSDAVAVVIQPGDLLLFSGAHLHATVPNTSGVPRFSVEIRTVALDDVRAGRGAPNVDGAAPRVPWNWFRRVDDRTPLSDVLA
ncbi:MAG: phytanoyl-CoA dioxygenase family protein [Actinobacteria bacterium]|nr:phytanoyl-CoA dioxygenase family protein [Actinomycetota bacterium]